MDTRALANIYLRQAEKTSNARSYLDAIITARLATITAQQGGAITSTSVNGKSVTYQANAESSVAGQMGAAQLALTALEAGLSRVPNKTYGCLR